MNKINIVVFSADKPKSSKTNLLPDGSISYGVSKEFFEFVDVENFDEEETLRSIEVSKTAAKKEGYRYIKNNKVWHMNSPKPVDELTDDEARGMMSYNTTYGEHVGTTDHFADECPEGYCYICHKCGGNLKGASEIAGCHCISGWIRPSQEPVKIKGLKLNKDNRVGRHNEESLVEL